MGGVYLIGLTGGIASGKSTVSARLARHGAVIVDADLLAREVVEAGSPTLAELDRAFGSEVIAADGSLDRARLGARVFGDGAELARLNAIVHPAVRALSDQRIRAAAAADPAAVVVYDVPLLVESEVTHPFDLVVVTRADEATRVRRMVELRGMDPGDATRRIRAQAADAERLAIADAVIDTDGTLEQTIEQVDALWERVQGDRGGSAGGNVGGRI